MTPSEERGPPVHAQRKFISKAITSLYIALDDVHQEMATTGDISDSTRGELQSQLATVTVILRTHRNDDRINWDQLTPFEDGPDSLIGSMIEGKTETQYEKGVHNPQSREVAAPVRFDIETLYVAATDILSAADKLGLTADVSDQTAEEHPDPV